MKKAAGIAVGVVVVVGALATVGAWYTGSQVEGVLQNAVANANQQFASSVVGADGRPMLHLELVSVDRQLFSSTAHLRLQMHSKEFLGDDQPAEFLFVDHIEHGPLPLSRLKSLKLMPVMVTNNVALEPSPSSAAWFAAAGNESPFKAQLDVHYGGDTSGTLDALPLKGDPATGGQSFSGLHSNLNVSANGERYGLTGKMADMQLNLVNADGVPVQFVAKDFTFNLGGTRGESGFYLGHNDATLGNLRVQMQGGLPFEVQGMKTTSLAQEVGGALSGEMGYDVASMSLGGTPLGQWRMLFKFGQFDVQSSRSLYQLLQTKVMPQQRAAAAAGVPFRLQLDDADQQRLKTDLSRFLAAKPHMELQEFTLKTANGEGRVNLSVDLAPAPLSSTTVAPAYGPSIVGAVDAKVVLSKAMLNDLGTTQARLQGATDPAAIARQGTDFSNMVSGLAVMMQLGKVEGDDVVSELHYAAGMVDFNGQRMTAAQFIGSVLGRVGAVGARPAP
jgi:uncharacterized protein YdgA (DUF945 family)